MDERELAQEMLAWLNAHGQYTNFIEWCGERGFDKEDLDADLTLLED